MMKNFKAGTYGSLFVLAAFAFGMVGSAQPPAPVYHPGQVLTISVAFHGLDAGKVTAAQIRLRIQQSGNNQPGFQTEIFPGESKPTGPNTFEVSYQIPESQASGEYQLSEIRARVAVDRDAPITLFYNSPGDFEAMVFKIDNHKTIVKPTITVSEFSKP